jgi:hypothetical protein
MKRARDSLPNETVREREVRREAEINAAVRGEAVAHAAMIKNMHRLRLLRLQREAQQSVAAKSISRRKRAAFPPPPDHL